MAQDIGLWHVAEDPRVSPSVCLRYCYHILLSQGSTTRTLLIRIFIHISHSNCTFFSVFGSYDGWGKPQWISKPFGQELWLRRQKPLTLDVCGTVLN